MKKVIVLSGLLLGVLLAISCAGPISTPAPTPHPALEAKPVKPEGLEAEVQIDMHDVYFANPAGEKNPTFILPAGKTVGIHLHNEGGSVHELMMGREVEFMEMEMEGRKVTRPHGYHENLLRLVEWDLFFYYNGVKAEVGEAEFGEIRVDQGIRDIWLRAKIPEELRGEWEIGCFVPGHYEAGMRAKLIIK